MPGNISGCHKWGRGSCYQKDEQMPGMLLNILKSTGQPPTTKNYPPQNANTVKVEKLIFQKVSKHPSV